MTAQNIKVVVEYIKKSLPWQFYS